MRTPLKQIKELFAIKIKQDKLKKDAEELKKVVKPYVEKCKDGKYSCDEGLLSAFVDERAIDAKKLMDLYSSKKISKETFLKCVNVSVPSCEKELDEKVFNKLVKVKVNGKNQFQVKPTKKKRTKKAA